MSTATDRGQCTDYPGGGNLARTMELLWGLAPRGSRGPKPKLTVEEITGAAIALADAEGLEALSMRRLAEALEVGTMSLYRYVPGRPELLDLMVDRVSGETRPAPDMEVGWRRRLEHVARENVALYLRHSWLLQVFPGRPPMGPGVLRKYDHELRSLEGCGLGDVELNLVLDLVLGFVRGAAMTWVEASSLEERTGLSDQAWWAALAPTLEQVFDPEEYPLAARIGAAATAHYGGSYDPELAFEFGLERMLDGVAVLIGGPTAASRRKRRS
jgi:AcrR family transcriptional regulator